MLELALLPLHSIINQNCVLCVLAKRRQKGRRKNAVTEGFNDAKMSSKNVARQLVRSPLLTLAPWLALQVRCRSRKTAAVKLHCHRQMRKCSCCCSPVFASLFFLATLFGPPFPSCGCTLTNPSTNEAAGYIARI